MWLIRRTTLTLASPARYGDILDVRTWIADFRRVRSQREYEVRAGDRLVARASTDWVFVDRAHGPPAPHPGRMGATLRCPTGRRQRSASRFPRAEPPPSATTLAAPRRAARARRAPARQQRQLRRRTSSRPRSTRRAPPAGRSPRRSPPAAASAPSATISSISTPRSTASASRSRPGRSRSTADSVERHTHLHRGDADRPLLHARSRYQWIERATTPTPMPAALRAALARALICGGSRLPVSSRAMNAPRRTRKVAIGRQRVGGDAPVVVQSMCATKTRDIDATVAQVRAAAPPPAPASCASPSTTRRRSRRCKEIRAPDRRRDARRSICRRTTASRPRSAPYVDKIRYNPGHLHHVERDKSIARQGRAGWPTSRATTTARSASASTAARSRPSSSSATPATSSRRIVQSALYHCDLMERARLRSLRRVAQGLRSRQGGRRQLALRRGAARRAAPPRRHRGRHAAGGHHQEPPRLREAARRAASATRSASR